MKFDLHTHTYYSKDSKTPPEDLVKAAKAKGLAGIAVTDHDSIKGALDAKRAAEEDFQVIIASEIKTKQGDLIGYFLQEDIPRKDFFEVVDAIHDQDGIACIPHPYDWVRITSSIIPKDEMLKAVDRIEVLNARCVLEGFNQKAVKMSEKYGLGITAGSDAHLPSEVGGAGVILEDVEDLRKKKVLPLFGGEADLGDQIKARLKRFI